MKWHNGTSFVEKPVKYFDGSVWKTGAMRAWNGTAWVPSASAPVEAETTAYHSAITAAGGTLSPEQFAAYNEFIGKLKTASVWDKLLDIGTFGGGTLASAAVKLKSLSGSNCVLNGFVLADLTAFGLKNTGTKWVNTQVHSNHLPANGGYAGLGVFMTEAFTNTAQCTLMGNATTNGAGMFIRHRSSTNPAASFTDFYARATSTRTELQHRRGRPPIGLYHVEREGGVVLAYMGGYRASTAASTHTVVANTVPFGVLSMGNGSNNTTGTVGMYFISTGVTEANAAVVAEACNLLMVRLGRKTLVLSQRFNAVGVVGQSLAVGSNGTPALSTVQSFGNLAPDSLALGGNPNDNNVNYLSSNGRAANVGVLMPLVEQTMETISTSSAAMVSQAARNAGQGSAFDATYYNLGIGATNYNGMRKGTAPYSNLLLCFSSAKTSKTFHGVNLPLVVPYLLAVHGESDAGSSAYGVNIRQWQIDYETDIKAITGQSQGVPMFHSQPSSWTSPNNINNAVGISPYQIWQESLTNPKILLVCPKYFLVHVADGVHLNNTSYQLLGAYYGKAVAKHMITGTPWKPFQPVSAVRTGANIDITFEGMVGGCTFDTTAVTDPSPNGTMGFEYFDSNNPAANRYTAISSVTVIDYNKIRVTLAEVPTGTGQRIRYAYTGTAGQSGGPTTGPRGCLRDMDTTLGPSNAYLRNWCIHFDMGVT